MVQRANVGSCQKPPFSESVRNDGFVPVHVTPVHPEDGDQRLVPMPRSLIVNGG